MKIQQSTQISAFGGINFVYEDFQAMGLGRLFEKNLPVLAANSQYTWKDILYSLFSIFFCGGDAIEDIGSKLSPHLKDNPYCKLPSPDTLLRRMADLSVEDGYCRCKRGSVTHHYNSNQALCALNIKLVKHLGAFKAPTLTLDYDNTIVYNEKADSVLTYKKAPGYQPGLCTLNTNTIIYVENRNGNSDAKAFQEQTLTRMFALLDSQDIEKIDNFRADAASYQFDVIQLVEKHVKHFYIGTRNDYVENYFTQIANWQQCKDSKGEPIWIGAINYRPFTKYYSAKERPKQYRLIVKKKPNKDGQINMITQEAFQYRAIITNDFCKTAKDIIAFYNNRGAMEQQFDMLKNDFGWKHMPFSSLGKNNVFLILMAMCRNIYQSIIQRFAQKFEGVKSTFRMKRFIFKIIILPAKWIRSARQEFLKIYGDIAFKT